MAEDAFIDRVDTQVAMALGASVHPFTKITPKVRIAGTVRRGLCISCSINTVKPIVK